jgi:hypothetical protein
MSPFVPMSFLSLPVLCLCLSCSILLPVSACSMLPHFLGLGSFLSLPVLCFCLSLFNSPSCLCRPGLLHVLLLSSSCLCLFNAFACACCSLFPISAYQIFCLPLFQSPSCLCMLNDTACLLIPSPSFFCLLYASACPCYRLLPVFSLSMLLTSAVLVSFLSLLFNGSACPDPGFFLSLLFISSVCPLPGRESIPGRLTRFTNPGTA